VPTDPVALSRRLRSLERRCPATDPALWQAPGLATLLALDVDDSEAVRREPAAGGGRAVRRCRAAVGRARSLVLVGAMRAAIRCQHRLERDGRLADPCAASASPVAARAARLVTRTCGGTSAAAAGTCEPLPACVVEAATRAGQVAVESAYAYPGSSGTTAYFSLAAPGAVTAATFFDFPYPSDLRLRDDGTPDVATYPTSDQSPIAASLRGLRDAAGRRPAFPAIATSYVRFTGPLAARDPAAVIPADSGAPILLVNVDDAPSALRGRLYPVVAHALPADTWTPEHVLAVGPMPGTVLPPGHRYALVVRPAAADASGAPLDVGIDVLRLRAGATPAGARGADVRRLYEPLWSTLDEIGVARASVVAATVFTVGDVVAELAEMSSRLVARHPTAVADITLDETLPRVCELRGTIALPQFQRGTPPYDTLGDFELAADGLPRVQRDDVAPVVITLPRAPMPPGGYPLVLYFHGSAGRAAQVIDRGRTLVAGPNGETDPTPGEGPGHVVAEHGIAAVGSGLPTNPERLAGAELRAYLNLGNLAAYRYTFQQGTIEQRMLIDALGRLAIDPAVLAGCSGPTLPAGETAFRLRADRIGIMGQSMGGQYTNMVGAVEPRVAGAVPTGSGGLFGLVVLEAEEVDGLGPVPIDVRPLIPGLIDAATPLSFLHPAFGLLETAWEGAETVVFAPRLVLDPLPGMPAGRAMYQPVAIDDPGFPSSIYTLMALASGTQQAGDQLFAGLQAALATAGRDGLAAYPVRDNLVSAAGAPYTGVVAQYASDGILDGHHIFTQLDAVRYQYGCFFDSLLNGGTAVVPAPAPLGTLCPR
jgi:hypothetical protein